MDATEAKQRILEFHFVQALQMKQFISSMKQFCLQQKLDWAKAALVFVTKVAKFKKVHREGVLQKAWFICQKLYSKFFETNLFETLQVVRPTKEFEEAKNNLRPRLFEVISEGEKIVYEDEPSVQHRLSSLMPVDLFSTLESLFTASLGVHMFPKFLQSKICQSLLQQFSTDAPFKKEILEKLSRINFDDPLSDVVFHIEDSIQRLDTTITQGDVWLLKYIATYEEADTWRIIHAEKQYTVKESIHKYCLSLSSASGEVKWAKVEGMFTYPISQVIDTLLTMRCKTMYDNLFLQYSTLETVPRNSQRSFDSVIAVESHPFAFPVKNREFCTLNSVVRLEQENQICILQKSTHHHGAVFKKGTIRGRVFSGYILEPSSSGKETYYTYVSCCDFTALSGTSDKILQKYIEKRVVHFHKAMLHCLSKMTVAYGEPNELECIKLTMQNNVVDKLLLDNTISSTLLYPLEPNISTTMELSQSINNNTISNIKRITYYSLFNGSLTNTQLQQIEITAKRFNQRHRITGLLMYTRDAKIGKETVGVFYQVLEGPKHIIDTLYSKICNDTRHKRATIVTEEEELNEWDRHYPSWSMETFDLESKDHFFCSTLRQLLRAYDSRLATILK